MSKLKDRLTQANQSHNFSFSLLDDSAHICGHIDQSFVHESVHNSREISRCENGSFLNDLNFSNQTGQFGQQKQNYLCCRTFFTEKQIIQQPQSTKYEFKGFKFPLKSNRNQRIKKTICSFLNCKGGFIFIGIVENVTTKQHKVVGDTYNQAQKQEILKEMRKNAQCIEPEIIMSKKMEISFVPVKFSFYPYSFIPGRFVIKIKIYPGSKDEVYTVCCDDQLLVCMRTENQVLSYDPKKNFRKMLQIQKERVKNIHDLSQSFYKHRCKRPQNGIRIFSRQNRILAKQNRCTSGPKQKNLNKRRFRKERSTSSSATREQTNELQNMKKHKFTVANKHQNQKYKDDSSHELSYISSSSSEQEKKKKEIKSKKQRKIQKRNEKDNQKIEEIIMKQPKQLRNNKVIKEKDQQMKVSCERIVERFYSAKKQQKNMKQNHCIQAQIMQKVYQRRSVKSVQKKKEYERKSESKSQKEIKQRASPKSRSSRSSSKKRQQMQQKYLALEKHLNKSVNHGEGGLQNLINEMIAINHTSHKIFGFAGFSKNRIETIKDELARINENDYYQFSNLLVYKFSKNSNENSLKQAISKSIKTNRLSPTPTQPQLQPIPYPNTTKKQKKSPKLNISFEYNQQSICEQPQHKSKQKQSKEYRIVFKLTNRIKILMYNTLQNETKQKIKDNIKLIEKLSMKKNIYDNNYWDDNYLEVQKVKELYLPNMYYALLVYLELVKFDIRMLFF